MRGYAAFQAVLPTIRPARHASRPEPLSRSRDLDDLAVVLDTDVTQREPLMARLRDAWADVREVWAQTTFFVLDPNSWG